MRREAGASEGARDPCRGLRQALTLLSPSHLQEAEKQNRSLQEELVALREELRARRPGGEWLPACLAWRSPQLQPHVTKGVPHGLAVLWTQEFVPDSATSPTIG